MILFFQPVFPFRHLFFDVINGIYCLMISILLAFYSIHYYKFLYGDPILKKMAIAMGFNSAQFSLLIVSVVFYGITTEFWNSGFQYWVMNSVIRIQEFILLCTSFLVLQKRSCSCLWK